MNQNLREVGIDTSVALIVGVGQCIAGNSTQTGSHDLTIYFVFSAIKFTILVEVYVKAWYNILDS